MKFRYKTCRHFLTHSAFASATRTRERIGTVHLPPEPVEPSTIMQEPVLTHLK